MNDLIDRLETEVTELATRDTLTADDVCLLLTQLDGMARRIKETRAGLVQFLEKWLPQNGGELRIGEVRYWIAPNKTVKCLNNAKCVQALFEITGGDFDAVTDCLASDAIKHGAARKILGDKYKEHFVTKITAKLENDGKPKKSLQSVNEHFIK